MSNSIRWRAIGANSFWVFLATFSQAFTQWAIMTFIARQDGPVTLGNYALAQAFANPAGYLAWLNLRQQYVISKLENSGWPDFLFLRVVVSMVAFMTIVAGIYLYYQDLSIFGIAAGVFIVKHAEGLFDLSYGRLQFERRTTQLGTYSAVRAILSVPIFYICYSLIRDLTISLVWFAVVNYAFFAFQSLRLKMDILPLGFFDFSAERSRSRLSLIVHLVPYAISSVMMALVTSVPRFTLEFSVGAAELGRFAAVAHFLAVGSVVVGSMAHGLAGPLVAARDSKSIRDFLTLVYGPSIVIQLLCLVAIVVAAFVGETLVVGIYGSAFTGGKELLIWTSIAAGPVYAVAIAGFGCYTLQKQVSFFWIQTAGVVLVGLLTLCFAPNLRANAAFLGMAVCGIVQIVAFSVVFWSTAKEWRRENAVADSMRA